MTFSILRYPGGKGRFASTLSRYVKESGCRRLIEPFAGGAAAGLTLLSNGDIDQLILIELDPRVSAFWLKVKTDEKFADQVLRFKQAPKIPLLQQEAALERRRKKLEIYLRRIEKIDLGMWTLVKNRCSFGGYLSGGLLLRGFGKPTATKARNGAEGSGYQGVGSQWNPTSLAERIEKTHRWFKEKKIIFVAGDAFKEMPKYEDAFAFVDAPYSCGEDAPGKKLYSKHELDHEELFDLLEGRESPWLATYNNSAEVRNLASHYGFGVKKIAMSRLHADADSTAKKTYEEIILTPNKRVSSRAD